MCFHAEDVPAFGFPHFIVLISDACEDKALVIPISSIKFSGNAKYKYKNKSCKYYDDACVFDGTELSDDNGRAILTKPSFARYEWALEIDKTEIFKKQLDKVYSYKGYVTPQVLKALQDGAKKSKELKPYFNKYFPFF